MDKTSMNLIKTNFRAKAQRRKERMNNTIRIELNGLLEGGNQKTAFNPQTEIRSPHSDQNLCFSLRALRLCARQV
jgi:hypothetical protein